MKSALLLAEPEAATRGFLERHLREDGFDVLGAAAGHEALELAEQVRPDLALLAEVDLCSRLREGEPGRSWDRDVPVIVLAPGPADVVDRVRALAGGCDDYVARPFHYEELLARINALLRRTAPRPRQRLAVDGMVIDRHTRGVTVDGRDVDLSSREFELVAKLASEPRRVFTKDELLRDVWG